MAEAQVRLRPLTEADLPDYKRWSQDPEISQFMTREMGEITDEQRRAWFERVSASGGTERVWAIEADGHHIGNCALRIEESGKTGNVGILIGDKTRWGKGYGTAALREVLRIGFAEMHLLRIWLTVAARNVRGVRSYEKCGFRHEGVRRRSRLKRGKWLDEVIMAILREDWEAGERGLAPEQLLVRPERIAEWRSCMDALSPKPGEVILDAGCGDGLRTLLVASRVAPSGRIIGIEVKRGSADKAIERIAAHGMQAIASVQCGDIRSLPLADDTVDAWFCRETLEYLDDPLRALSEAVRVVRPGGRVVAVEADWDTLAYNATDKAAERRFVAVHTDCGGGGSADGRMGRKLLSLCREAGLADLRLEVHARWSDNYSPDEEYACRPLGEGVVRRGCMTQDELDAWYADMSAQAQRGRYFHSFNYYTCVGRVK